MKDVKTIITALRYCALRTKEQTTCEGCVYEGEGPKVSGILCPILNDAANALEDKQNDAE